MTGAVRGLPPVAEASPSTARPAVSPMRVLQGLALVVGIMASAGLTGALIGRSAQAVAGNRMAPWIIGRAAGISSYLLMVALVLMGLVLSHPARSRIRWPGAAARIRTHIVLSVFTLIFTTLHVVVLATDPYAGVGWPGVVLPMHAAYRPVATTLGLISVWAGLVTGITAALAGHLPLRLWWPVHKVASATLVLVWLHGVLGGGDTGVLLAMYLVTGGLVVAVAVSRYTARTRADRIADLEATSGRP